MPLLALILTLLLLALILVAYWREKSDWRYCPRCQHFWHVKRQTQTLIIPDECEGYAPSEVCRLCD